MREPASEPVSKRGQNDDDDGWKFKEIGSISFAIMPPIVSANMTMKFANNYYHIHLSIHRCGGGASVPACLPANFDN